MSHRLTVLPSEAVEIVRARVREALDENQVEIFCGDCERRLTHSAKGSEPRVFYKDAETVCEIGSKACARNSPDFCRWCARATSMEGVRQAPPDAFANFAKALLGQ